MDGLLIRLRDDKYGTPANWFWPCFKPLRSTFDRHFWIFPKQPWMGTPLDFDSEKEMQEFEGVGETSVGLWRPGAVGRWAKDFCEEHIELWAIDPADDPARIASEFRLTIPWREEPFTEKHAKIWLLYSDSTCWEIFARDADQLRKVRDHVSDHTSLRAYESNSGDRGRAFEKAGIGEMWRAMRGQSN